MPDRLHQGDGPEGDARPVERADADATGHDGAEPLHQAVGRVEQPHRQGGAGELDPVDGVALRTLDLR